MVVTGVQNFNGQALPDPQQIQELLDFIGQLKAAVEEGALVHMGRSDEGDNYLLEMNATDNPFDAVKEVHVLSDSKLAGISQGLGLSSYQDYFGDRYANNAEILDTAIDEYSQIYADAQEIFDKYDIKIDGLDDGGPVSSELLLQGLERYAGAAIGLDDAVGKALGVVPEDAVDDRAALENVKGTLESMIEGVTYAAGDQQFFKTIENDFQEKAGFPNLGRNFDSRELGDIPLPQERPGVELQQVQP